MSSSSFDFAAWPPALTPEQQAILVQKATTRALATGLLYLPPGYPLDTPPPQAAIHAPLSLFPAPFPRGSFRQAQEIQSLYNVLYSNIAMDTVWLDEIMGAEKGVGRVDDFIGQLWRGWKEMRDGGKISQVGQQPVAFLHVLKNVTASASRIVPFRLPIPRPGVRGSFAEASRIQHNISLFWLPLSTYSGTT